jgi:hypothetical protein
MKIGSQMVKIMKNLVLMMAVSSLLLFSQAFGQTTSQTQPTSPTPTATPSPTPIPPVELKLNEPMERELKSEEIHEYQITLKAGEFMNIQVEEKGLEIDAVLFDAEGKELNTFLIPFKS